MSPPIGAGAAEPEVQEVQPPQLLQAGWQQLFFLQANKRSSKRGFLQQLLQEGASQHLGSQTGAAQHLGSQTGAAQHLGSQTGASQHLGSQEGASQQEDSQHESFLQQRLRSNKERRPLKRSSFFFLQQLLQGSQQEGSSQHLGSQQTGSQHFGSQHLGSQQEVSQQLGAAQQPPFLAPNMRSSNSRPKLWLHRAALNSSAMANLFRFIEQRLLCSIGGEQRWPHWLWFGHLSLGARISRLQSAHLAWVEYRGREPLQPRLVTNGMRQA